jgi:hypothetical protein
VTFPTPNNDESLVSAIAPFIGNFHKTLPHNAFGEVVAHDYRTFERICKAIDGGAPINFEGVPKGPIPSTGWHGNVPMDVAKFTSPLAGAATEHLGPDPRELNMPPAPGILSESCASEMTELYWMALLRDHALADFATDPLVGTAVTELATRFGQALANDRVDGALTLVRDLPRAANGSLDIRRETLFRCGLKDEDYGPLVSQFFLHDIPYGVQTISTSQRPYAEGRDYLTAYDDWIRAQNTGYDKFGRAYANCNYFHDDPTNYYAVQTRKIATLRDLARFVNRDALHQAYFNAALFLDSINAPLDPGNPYRGARYSREAGFATLGGPDMLTLVSEVATRALKVVWRQKWLVNRRARPEAYGGLVQMQFIGHDEGKGKGLEQRAYGLPTWVSQTQAAQKIKTRNGIVNPGGDQTYFLPMAFSAGSPTHPAYGAGHATVAGACVTVLKAWYDEDASLGTVLVSAQNAANQKEPGSVLGLLQPGLRTGPDTYAAPTAYTGADAAKITVGGELNKVAANVAMGRSMGGVHWRTDNTRSLRLGEAIAIEILRKRTLEYAERPVTFTFRAFDRHTVQISQGQVRTF